MFHLMLSPCRVVYDLVRICKATLSHVKEISKIIKMGWVLDRQLNMDKTISTNLPNMFPLKSIEDLLRFEECLKNAETELCFIAKMKKIGGRDYKDHLNRCLKFVFSNELGVTCSYEGRKGNYKLKDTQIANILIENLMAWHSATLAECQTVLTEWFRLSKQRLMREQQKKIDASELIRTIRRKPNMPRYIVDGFVFHVNITKGNPPMIYLRCLEYKRLGCHARAIIPYDGTIHDIKINKPHNHPPDHDAEEKIMFLRELKEVLLNNPNVPSRTVYTTLSEMYPNAAREFHFETIRHKMNRWRKSAESVARHGGKFDHEDEQDHEIP